MRASGRSGRGLKTASDKVLERPVSWAGSLSANSGGGQSSSALHMRLNRLLFLLITSKDRARGVSQEGGVFS